MFARERKIRHTTSCVLLVLAMVLSGFSAGGARAADENGAVPRDITNDGNDLIIPAGEMLELSGTHGYARTVQINGTLRVSPFDGTDETTGMVQLTARWVIVGPTGVIVADGRGYGGGGGGANDYNQAQNGGKGGAAGKGGDGQAASWGSNVWWAGGGGGGSNGGLAGSGGNNAQDGTETGGGKGGDQPYGYTAGGPGGSGFGGGGGGGGGYTPGGGGGGGGGSGGNDSKWTAGGDGAGPAFGRGGKGTSGSISSSEAGKNGGYRAAGTNGDTTTDITTLRGSGGGGSGSSSSGGAGGGGGGGGAGGGAVVVISEGNLTMAGTITASGAGGGQCGNSVNVFGGGGAGGGITLIGRKLSVDGTIVSCGYAGNTATTTNGGTIKLIYTDRYITGTLVAGRVYQNGAPKMQGLSSPPQNTQVGSVHPPFTWKDAKDPDGDKVAYHIQVSASPGFAPWKINASGIAAARYVTPWNISLIGKDFFWRVRAADHIGFGDWSDVWKFSVDGIPPVTRVLPLPDYSTTADFEVSWEGTDNSVGISNYTIWLSDNDGPFAVWLEGTANLSAPFRGAEAHTYRFYSVGLDLAENREDPPALPDATTTVDSVPPLARLGQLAPYQMKPAFLVSWSGKDATSGISNYTVYVSMDGGEFSAWLEGTIDSSAQYQGAEGHRYTFYVRSTDIAGNAQAVPGPESMLTTLVDGTPPATSMNIDGPVYGDRPVYFGPATLFYLNGTDNYAGVDLTYYMIDDRPMQEFTRALKEARAGSHNISFWSVDEAGNEETHRTVWFYIDGELPSSLLSFLGPSWSAESLTYISGQTQIVIISSDRGSGVKSSTYNIDGAGNLAYDGPFRLGRTGAHLLKFYSTDNLGQEDAEKNATLIVDVDPPTTIGKADARISRETVKVSFTATDFVSGAGDTFFRVTRKGEPAMSFQNGSEAFVQSSEDHARDGVYAIEFYSVDRVGNKEQTRSLTVTIDTTGTLELGLKGETSVSTDTFALKGTAEPGSRVSVNGRDVPVRTDGGFELDLALAPGRNKFVVEATDPAGNTVSLTRYITYDQPSELGGWVVMLAAIAVIVALTAAAVLVFLRKGRKAAPVPGAPRPPSPPPVPPPIPLPERWEDGERGG